MRKITRTIPTSIIKASSVEVVDGKIDVKPIEPIAVIGETVSLENAMKHVYSKMGKGKNYIVTEVEVKENNYEISLENFIRYGKLVEPKATANTEVKA
jgi:hypothetical protein